MGKREDILAATRDLIVEHGIESLSFSKIFARAGVGSGTVYNYFSSKEELIVTLYREVNLLLSREVLADYDPSNGIKERFFQLAKNLVQFVTHFRKELAVQNALAHSPYIPSEERMPATPSTEVVLSLFSEGQKSGVLAPMNPIVAFSFVSSALISVTNGQLIGKYGSDQTAVDQAIEACWRAISTSP